MEENLEIIAGAAAAGWTGALGGTGRQRPPGP